MKVEIGVFPIVDICIRRIGSGKAAIAAEGGGPTLGAGSRRVEQRAVVLGAADDVARCGIGSNPIELRDAQVVVQIGPTGRARDRGIVARAIDAAIVAEVERLVAAAVEAGGLDNDVLVGVSRGLRSAPPFADGCQSCAAIRAAPKIHTAHDQLVGIGRIDPDGVRVPALPAEETVAGVDKGVRGSAVGAFPDLAGMHIDGGIDRV